MTEIIFPFLEAYGLPGAIIGWLIWSMTHAYLMNGVWMPTTPNAFRKAQGASIPDSRLADFGCHKITTPPRPEVEAHQVAETGPLEDVDGLPVRSWVVRDKTLDDLPFKTAQEAKDAMTAWIDGLTGIIQNQYPEVVQKGWYEEEAMARAFFAGNMTDVQESTLTRDAAAKDRTPEEHANRIIANADQFRGIADQTRSLWLATDAAIDAATDPHEYETILASAQMQAAPLAEAYGLT